MSHIQNESITPCSMNSQDLEIFINRILAFNLDQPGVSLSYSQRLAREHGWSFAYTQRVAVEYKKFLILTQIAGHPVTPSIDVDEAWHLHLTYTHSYWDELCGQLLQKPLHHNPTKGGESQRKLFWDCYTKTLNSYERVFGYPAPADIWQSPTIRFREAGQFKRVSSREYWLIPKPLKIFHSLSLRVPSLSGQQVVIFALLALGFALSWDFLYHQALGYIINFFIDQPAVAQVYSQPAQSTIGSKLKFELLQIPKLEVIEKWIITHSRFVLWIGLSIGNFVVGIVLSFRPIFVHPVGKLRIGDGQYDVFTIPFTISTFCVVIYLWSYPSIQYISLIGLNGAIFLLLYMFSSGLIYGLEIEILRFLKYVSKQEFPRQLYCNVCNQKLKRLSSLNDVLNEKERIAVRIKSIRFEAWHCEKCYQETNRESTHLRSYVSLSDYFRFCEDCREFTMTKTSSKIIREATTEKIGKKLSVYTCHCCSKSVEKIELIPKVKVNDSGCAGCACI